LASFAPLKNKLYFIAQTRQCRQQLRKIPCSVLFGKRPAGLERKKFSDSPDQEIFLDKPSKRLKKTAHDPADHHHARKLRSGSRNEPIGRPVIGQARFSIRS
jgi:hypothetical protein